MFSEGKLLLVIEKEFLVVHGIISTEKCNEDAF
jgi:hypothetical protein